MKTLRRYRHDYTMQQDARTKFIVQPSGDRTGSGGAVTIYIVEVIVRGVK